MIVEFGPEKNRANMAKHGIPLSDAQCLDWNSALQWPDRRKDYGEPRWCALALLDGRLHHVAYVVRGTTWRIISLRRANRREWRTYGRR